MLRCWQQPLRQHVLRTAKEQKYHPTAHGPLTAPSASSLPLIRLLSIRFRFTVVFGAHSAASGTDQNPGGYPFYFNNLSPANQQVQSTMTLLNNRAIQFYHDQEALLPYQNKWSNLRRSPYGITSIAVFYTEHAFGVTACEGVVEWINATNVVRNGTDTIVVVDNTQIPIVDAVITADSFIPFFQPLPPYDLDLLVVCGAPAQSSAVIQALATSQVRPKAFLYLSDDLLLDTTDPVVAEGMFGMYTFGYRTADESLAATLPGVMFSNRSVVEDMYGAYAGEEASLVVLRTLAAWETMISCVTQSYYSYMPLDPDSLWFSFIYNKGRNFLNNVDFTGNDVSSQINTGFNDLIITRQHNANNTAPTTLTTAAQARYPTDWPWYRVVTGDLLVQQLAASSVLIGCVFVILGAWVAVIIIEQAVFERRRGGWYQPWLFMVAFMLSGAGSWCSVWMQLDGVQLFKANDMSSSLSTSYSLAVALLALLIGSICSWAALMLAIRDVDDDSDRLKYRSETAQMRLQHKERKAARKKLAALSHKAHAMQLLDSVTWKVVVSGLILAASIALQRYCLMWTVEATATWAIEWQAWIILAFTQSLLLPICILLYLHALRWRMCAVLLFAASVIIDLHVTLAYTNYYLADDVQYGSSTWHLGTSISISGLAVDLISGITAATTCFMFVSLQFSRMQLSRNGLALLVANLEHINVTLKGQLQRSQGVSAKLQQQADALVTIIETINICRPLPQEYAFGMALYSNTSTFRQQLTPLLEGTAGKDESSMPDGFKSPEKLLSPTGAGGGSNASSLRSRSVISPTNGSSSNLTEGVDGTPKSSARRIEQAGSVLQIQQHSSRANAITAVAARQPSISVEDEGGRVTGMPAIVSKSETEEGGVSEGNHHDMVVQHIVDPPAGPASPAAPSPPSSHRSQLVLNRVTSPSGNTRQPIRIGSPSAGVRPAYAGNDHERASHSGPSGRERSSNSNHDPSSGNGAGADDNAIEKSSVSVGAFSTTSLLGQAVYQFDHGKRCKEYETSMHKQIVAQMQHTMAIRAQQECSVQPGQAKKASGWDHSEQSDVFSLTQPLSGLAPAKSISGSSRASVAVSGLKSPLMDGHNMALSVAITTMKRDTSSSHSNQASSALPNAVLSDGNTDDQNGSTADASKEWPLPSLAEMLLHPVCLELLKDALSQIHSEENLVFYLHVTRYRRLANGKLRTVLANEVYDAFIREGAPQQININTRQRERIAAVVRKPPSEFPAAVFLEAEKEVRLLMETNLMKTFRGSERHRLCAWIMAAVPLKCAAGMLIAEQNNDSLMMANAEGVHEMPDEPVQEWGEHSVTGSGGGSMGSGGGMGATEVSEA